MVCFALLILFVVITTVVVFSGSTGRLKLERDSLRERRKEQLAEIKRVEEDKTAADNRLKEFQKAAAGVK